MDPARPMGFTRVQPNVTCDMCLGLWPSMRHAHTSTHISVPHLCRRFYLWHSMLRTRGAERRIFPQIPARLGLQVGGEDVACD